MYSLTQCNEQVESFSSLLAAIQSLQNELLSETLPDNDCISGVIWVNSLKTKKNWPRINQALFVATERVLIHPQQCSPLLYDLVINTQNVHTWLNHLDPNAHPYFCQKCSSVKTEGCFRSFSGL